MLHHPAYLDEYRVDLLREFPRLPFYANFGEWARMGNQLLEMHVGFEGAEPYPLERVDTAKEPTRVMLRANREDKERGVIHVDDGTLLRGVQSRRGATGWGAAPPWSGCWTSTRSASPGTRP